MKKKSIGILLTLLTSATFASAPAFADVDCTKVINTTCTGCHSKSRICAKIGKTEKYWAGIIKLMISNGADITEEESTALTTCLSKPEEACTEACK